MKLMIQLLILIGLFFSLRGLGMAFHTALSLLLVVLKLVAHLNLY